MSSPLHQLDPTFAQDRNNPALDRWDLVVLLVVGLLLALNLWRLEGIPTNVTGDEVTFLNEILHITYLPEGRSPLSLMGDGTKAGIGLHYVSAVAGAFAEDHAVLGMRVASVILGILSLGAFYVYLRHKVSRVPALCAILLLGTNYVYLNLSRATWMAHGTGIGLVFGLLSFLLVELGVSRGRWWLTALGGIAGGLALYSYLGTVFLPVVSIIYLAFLVIRRKMTVASMLVHAAAFSAAALLVFLPNLWTIAHDSGSFTTRPRAVFVASTDDAEYQDAEAASVVWRQFSETARGFLLLDPSVTGLGPENARYGPAGEAPVDGLTRLLFFVAVPFALFLRRKDLFQPAAAFVVMLVLTQMLTVHPPNFARGVFALPFIYLLLAVLLDGVWVGMRGQTPRVRNLMRAGMLAVILGTSLWNVQHYFEWSRSPELAEARQPAIEYWQVPLWIDEEKRRIMAGEEDLAITEDSWQQFIQEIELYAG